MEPYERNMKRLARYRPRLIDMIHYWLLGPCLTELKDSELRHILNALQRTTHERKEWTLAYYTKMLLDDRERKRAKFRKELEKLDNGD